MTSPARRHYQKMTAASATTNAETRRASGDQHELMLAQLWSDRRQLSDIKSVERKIAVKRDDLLPHFEDYVAGVLESRTGEQDEVLMTVMIWRFDVGDIAGALEIAAYAVAHKLDAPDRFQRDTASLIAERTAEEVLDAINDDTDPVACSYYGNQCAHAWQLVGAADKHDQITAKLEKAWGYALRGAGDAMGALPHLRNAFEKNSKIGVKKDIERLEREIKKAGESNKSEAEVEGDKTAGGNTPTGGTATASAEKNSGSQSTD